VYDIAEETMDGKKLRIVHYLNQFFGQQGGEDKADMGLKVKEGPVGPGIALQDILAEKGEVAATIICGDNHYAENIEAVTEEALTLIKPHEADLLVAGPAFAAGRYGMACGALCAGVQETLGMPAVTGMFEENPGVDLYRRKTYICKTGNNSLKMKDDLAHMAGFALKLLSKGINAKLVSKETIGRPSEDGYFPRGILKNEYTQKTAAERSVDMLLAKLQGRPFESEVPVPGFEDIPVPESVKNMGSCRIAVISDGGLVPRGNPDKMKGRGNQLLAVYDMESFLPENRSREGYEIAHTGYLPFEVMEDINRLVPIDALRELEKDNVIEKVYPRFFSTSGNVTSSKRCGEIGEEIADELKREGVQAAILTST
jgi:glycine reductase